MSAGSSHMVGLYAGDWRDLAGCDPRRGLLQVAGGGLPGQHDCATTGDGVGGPGAPDGAASMSPQSRLQREIAGRRVLVVGGARSGLAAADLLLRLGARVTLADASARPFEAPATAGLEARGLLVEPGRDDPGLLRGHDLVLLSPGIRMDHPLVVEAGAQGIEVTGELELAARLARAPLVCVTGTNGKSTTVELIGALLTAAGRRAPVVGNIGRPLSAYVLETEPHDVLVVEVSSFQLETARRLCPRVGVLLNVAADHLDRHGDLATYARLKLRVFMNQSGGDDAVMPADWDGPAAPGAGRRLRFGPEPQGIDEGATVVGEWIVVRAGGHEERLAPIERLGLRGPHNLRNVLAAVAAVERFGIDREALAEVLHRFTGLPHRLERIATLSGVAFVNDSKATNVHAMRSALASFGGGIHLLAGGRDKAGDFESVIGLVHERVRHVYRYGEAAERIEQAWPDAPGSSFGTLEAAVHAAAGLARSGEVVLLAPGCASFDQFRDYEERGAEFRRIVLELAARCAGIDGEAAVSDETDRPGVDPTGTRREGPR